jgi:WD40 repeat protein
MYRYCQFNAPVCRVSFISQCGVLAGLEDGQIRLCTSARKQISGKHKDPVYFIVNSNTSSETTSFLSIDRRGCCMLHDTSTIPSVKAWYRPFAALAVSPNGGLVAASHNRAIYVYSAIDGFSNTDLVLKDHNYNMTCAAFSYNGDFLLSSSSLKGFVWLWNIHTGALEIPVFEQQTPAVSLAFSPISDNVFATGSFGGCIRLYKAESGAAKLIVSRVVKGGCPVNVLAFSHDESHLAACSANYTVSLYETTKLILIRNFQGHTSVISSVTFSSNSDSVISGSRDKTVRFWPIRDWSDRTHHLFGDKMKRVVFCLMCVKNRNEKRGCKRGIPNLPMAIWLNMFLFFWATSIKQKDKRLDCVL